MTIQRINAGRGHWYKIDGRKADGVTTLIKDGLPKPALVYWSARTVAEYVADNLDQIAGMASMGRTSIVAALKEIPWTQRNTAAVKGTRVHALAEKLVAGEQVEVPDDLAGHVEACVRFLDDWQIQPLAVEAVIAHRRWRYAGTADLFAEGVPPGQATPVRAVFDYKTSASGIWPETALQLAAYQHAEVYLDADGQEKPVAELGLTCSYGVWLRTDGYDVIPLDTSEQVFKTFQHIAYVARRARDAKSWVGEAVQPKEYATR